MAEQRPVLSPAAERLAGNAEELKERLLTSFDGTVPRQPVPFYYRLALLLVAVTMVLLLLVYVGLVVLAAWYTYILFLRVSGVLGFVGGCILGILFLFMIKPFFARGVQEQLPRVLFPKAEPVLFAFVSKICRSVQAPVPREIYVTCDVNAAAGFSGGFFGFFGKQMALTIGLPLAGGLDLREFSGVLAHELGHFAQRTGIRANYVIRLINAWFAKVVYERDVWDERLKRWSSIGLLGLVLHLARALVWIVRSVLFLLMRVGQVISCNMSRQMEYDADRYSAHLAGSQAFLSTARRLPLLHVAAEAAFANVRFFYEEGRLADDLPALILGTRDQVPKEALDAVLKQLREQTTGMFDTHPADRDRNTRVRLENKEGLFVPPPRKLLKPLAPRKDVAEQTEAKAHDGVTTGQVGPANPYSDSRFPAASESAPDIDRSAQEATDPFAFQGLRAAPLAIPRPQTTGARKKEGDLVSDAPEAETYCPDFPASILFRDFSMLSKTASHDFYQAALGKTFDPKLLCSAEVFLKEQVREKESEKSLGRFFQGQLSFLRPLQIEMASFQDVLEQEEAVERIRVCRDRIREHLASYKAALAKLVDADDRLVRSRQVDLLLNAGFEYRGEDYIPPLEVAEREISEVRDSVRTELEPFESAVSRRLLASLQLVLIPELASAVNGAERMRDEVEHLVPALIRVRELLPGLLEVRASFQELNALCAMLEGQEIQDAGFHRVLTSRANELYSRARALQDRLEPIPYPFEHGRGDINLRQYALPMLPDGTEDLGGLMQSAAEALDKLFPLTFRILSRLTVIAERMEEAVGFERLPDPPSEDE